MHAVEKILAKNSGRKKMSTGETVTTEVDSTEINDLYLQTVYPFYEIGGEMVWDNTRAAFVLDHYAPAPDIKSASSHEEVRGFTKKDNLKYRFDTSYGVCHQVMPEVGVIYPGMTVVAMNSHTTAHGAFGAMGTGYGAIDMATVLMTGEFRFRIPKIIEVRLEGETKKGVYPKDVILHVLEKIKADGAVYRAIDFTGSYVERLSVVSRIIICNMTAEMGAEAAYMQPNQDVLDYVSKYTAYSCEAQCTNPDFRYQESYHWDVSELEPRLACPRSVDNVALLSKTILEQDVILNQGYVSSCTGGREEDIAETVRTLGGEYIPPYYRLVVVPASAEVMLSCIEKEYIQDLMKAGATIATPGYGACLGAREGIIARGECCISSTNRNLPGRMGSSKAEIYLASPTTVAAGIPNKRVTDPWQYLQGVGKWKR